MERARRRGAPHGAEGAPSAGVEDVAIVDEADRTRGCETIKTVFAAA